MNIEQLRTFLEVERLRHFGRAADALCVTQAAVSARIKNLEEQVGSQLFDRTRGKDIRLTTAGHRLRRHADTIVSGWQKARQELAVRATGEQISLGGSLRLWDVLLQQWIHRVHEQYPECAITAESHTPEVLTRRLLEGALDIAMMLEPAQSEWLEIREVGRLDLELVSTTCHAGVADALRANYVYVDWGIAHSIEHARRFPDLGPPQVRVSESRMALDFIRRFGGCAFLPRNMIEQDLESKALFRVADAPKFQRKVFCTYRLKNAKAAMIKKCIRAF